MFDYKKSALLGLIGVSVVLLSATLSPSAYANSTDDRLTRLEQKLDSRNDLEMMRSLDALQQEIQLLRGQIEVNQHEIEQLTTRQRDFYKDLDTRIERLSNPNAGTQSSTSTSAVKVHDTAVSTDTKPATSPTTPSAGKSNTTPSNNLEDLKYLPQGNTDPSKDETETLISPQSNASGASTSGVMDETTLYRAAYQQLMAKQYPSALTEFNQYLTSFPKGRYAPNVHYWLGEIHLIQRDPNAAQLAFSRVVDEHPEHQKAADALLKMGYTYQSMGDLAKARETLMMVKDKYKGTPAAEFADLRLNELQATL